MSWILLLSLLGTVLSLFIPLLMGQFITDVHMGIQGLFGMFTKAVSPTAPAQLVIHYKKTTFPIRKYDEMSL